VTLKVLSLFTGAGGLDLGLEEAGFSIAGCVEVDHDARETVRTNRPSWPLLRTPADRPGDVLKLEPSEILADFGLDQGDLTLLSGGPPCQPFSKSGLWVNGSTPGMDDPRAETLRAYLRVLEAALPECMLLENVHGISHANGDSESGALAMLRSELARINERCGTSYRPSLLDIDGADFGVPQRRRRLFVFAAKDGSELSAPAETHAADANLTQEKVRTAWDAIGELDDGRDRPELQPTGKWTGLLPSIPEGQNYLWHTPRGGGEPLFGWRTRYWSFLLKLAKDRPSWTLQAEPGPATGPFHWRSRLLSIEEMARLQTFPAGFAVNGDYRSARRQLGNAVPPAMGELLGFEIRSQLYGGAVPEELSLIPPAREDCPARERRRRVPKRYLDLRSEHPAHPGTGLGPRALERVEAI
jgi:DNA (cytosine-5)-methyltransferase 1